MTNLREYDNIVKRKTRLKNAVMEGANNTKISGTARKIKF